MRYLGLLASLIILIQTMGCTDVAPSISFMKPNDGSVTLTFETQFQVESNTYITTSTPTVTVNESRFEITEFAIGEAASCDDLTWQKKMDSYSLSLSAGDGLKTISYRYKTLVFTNTCQTLNIYLAASTPVAQSIATTATFTKDQIKYTNTTLNNLTLLANNVTEMKISNDASCTSGTWEAYSTTKNDWPLSSTNINTSVSAIFKDANGQTTACVKDDIYIDTIAPDVSTSVLELSSTATTLKTETPLLSWTSVSDSGAGLKNYEVSLGISPGGTEVVSWTNADLNLTYKFTSLSLSYGTYYLNLRAVDSVSNVSSAKSISFEIKPPAPTLSLSSPTASPGNNPSPTLLISGVNNGDTVNVYSDATCSNLMSSAVASGTSTSITIPTLAVDGTHTFFANATSTTTSECSSALTYVLDRVSPTLSISGPTPSIGSSRTQFEWTITYANADVVTLSSSDVILSGTATLGCSINVAGSGITSRTITVSGCTANSGDLGFTVNAGSARDTAGNLSISATTESLATIDNTPPLVTISSPSPTYGNVNTSFIWTVNYTDAASITLSNSHITLLGNDISGCTIQVGGTESSLSRQIIVKNCTGNSSLSLQISEDSARDNLGNKTTSIGHSESATVDQTIYVVEFEKTEDTVNEPTSVMPQYIKINVTPTPSTDITVHFGVSPLFTTAVYQTDFDLVSGSITIPAGSTSGQISYTYTGNTTQELSKVIQLRLNSIEGFGNFAIGSKQIFRRVIIDDDGGPSTGFSMISSGKDHSCGISTSGVLKCWGNNAYGQLGISGASNSVYPQVIESGVSYSHISSGSLHTCGITDTGTLKCWGYNTYGQLGDGTTVNRSASIIIDSGQTYSTISSGGTHTCGITTSGTLKCWGLNSNGQLGDGSISTRAFPVVIDSGVQYAAVSAGNSHTCAITSTGTLKCWGSNTYGQLGNGDTITKNTPTVIDNTTNYLKVSAGNNFTCGITYSNTLKCWGYNTYGQVGNGNTTNQFTPQEIDVGIVYSSISAGESHVCGITSNNTIKCWGYNPFGQLGNGTRVQSKTPIAIDSLTSYASISSGSGHTCGVTSTNNVGKCWGNNAMNQLGNGLTSMYTSPVTSSSDYAYDSLSIAYYHSCAITSSQTAQCWGYNLQNRVDPSLEIYRISPVTVDPGVNYVSIATGTAFTCGLTATGMIKCWGANTNGQIGDGTFNNKTFPTIIDSNSSYSQIAAGVSFSCGLTTAGKVKCWGNNTKGQLGDNTSTTRSSPVDIYEPNGYVFTAISLGSSHACALTNSGYVLCWGENSSGQLGRNNNSAINLSTPTLISSGNTYKSISAGTNHTCGITVSGILQCWGSNAGGQLGLGNFDSKYSPENVSDAANYKQVSAGNSYTCGITEDDSLKCWGYNSTGQLGNGTGAGTLNAPTTIDSPTAYSKVDTGANHTCGITTSGSIKCWGSNDAGELGLGLTTLYPTPIP